jgi:Family of unknown function (DUF6114)
VIGRRSGSRNGRTRQSPTRSAGERLENARHAFWVWRRTRPFWGGLLVVLAAAEMLVSEQAPLPVVTHIGIQGLAGYLIPTFLAFCGVLLWLNPIDRIIYSLLALFLALGSWITSNLGGFFVGMLVGVVGGALAFAWTTDSGYGSPGWFHGASRIALPSAGLVLIVHLKGRQPPQIEGPGGSTESARLALPSGAGHQAGYLRATSSEPTSDGNIAARDE